MEWFRADERAMATNQTLGPSPSTAEYVLPQPPRPAGEVVVVARRRDLQPALRRGSEVARALGERLLPTVESQQLFAGEVRERLGALDAMVPEASRAQLKGAIADVLAVLEWADAAQHELLRDTQLAASGAHPFDVAEACNDVANALQSPEQPVAVLGDAVRPYWGVGMHFAELIASALALVAERTLANGARSIEIESADGLLRLRVRTAGEPTDTVDPETIARFVRAAQQVHAAVKPDELGPGSTGLVLELAHPLA
jgi:hypothetical protein